MLKKTKISIILIILMLVVGCVLMFINWNKQRKQQNFLSDLQGEIVFTRRNSDKVSDVWKINANGTNEIMLFHNDKNGGVADNFNSGDPQWSDDGKNIYFRSMNEDGKTEVFEMNVNGENVKIAKNYTDYKLSDVTKESREKDIIVQEGSVYFINLKQEKIQVYKHKNYSAKFNWGATEASWSPDKEYIIFELNFGDIMIADKNGNVFKLTTGSNPDWK